MKYIKMSFTVLKRIVSNTSKIFESENFSKYVANISAIISTFAIVIAAYQYVASAPDRELSDNATAWEIVHDSNIANDRENVGLRFAVELLVRHDVDIKSFLIQGGYLDSFTLHGAYLFALTLNGSEARDAAFIQDHFDDGNFTDDELGYIYLDSSSFNGSKFTNVDLSHSIIYNDSFLDVTFENVDVDKAEISADQAYLFTMFGCVKDPKQDWTFPVTIENRKPIKITQKCKPWSFD